MPEATAMVQATIVDPDIRVRIDGVHVRKRRTSNRKQVGKGWDLENYQSTREVSLGNGIYYLEMEPYWRQIDPLPVWVEVKNTGTIPLSVECVVTQGLKRYKRLTVIKADESFNVPGIYDILYRVEVSTLPDLHVNYLKGISKRSGRFFESAGFFRIRDLKDQDAAELSSMINIKYIKSWKLAGFIRQAELACRIKLDADDFEKISHWSLKKVYDTPVPELAKESGQPEKNVNTMMDRLGELTLAIDYRYIRRITLGMVFKY